MNVREASEQLDAIWTVVARNETFRGYRPATVAATGMLGIIAASMQSWAVPYPDQQPARYVIWWCGTAVFAILLVSIELALDALRPKSAQRRQLMWKAIFQFIPCLAAGAGLTLTSLWYGSPRCEHLPGLWALCIGLGVVASCPYLDRRIMAAACYYQVAGLLGMLLPSLHLAYSPWFMGITFGMGQLLTGLILYQTRKDDGNEFEF